METERQKVGHRPGINDGDNMLPTYRTEPSADDAVDAWLGSHGQDEGAPAIAGDKLYLRTKSALYAFGEHAMN